MTYFVGIDWADQKHDVCVIDVNGRIQAEFIINDNNAGYAQLHQYLKTLNDVQILLEKPDGLLVDFLLQKRWFVQFIPPNISAARRPRRQKSDRGDAYLLAKLLQQHDPDVRPVLRSSDLCQQLRQVVIAHDKLQRELQRLALQLRYLLKRYYPAVLKVFRKPQQLITYAFIEAFPDPHRMASVTLDEFTAFFKSQRYRYMERLEDHLSIFKEEIPVRENTQSYQLHALALVAVLRAIQTQMQILRRQLGCLFRQHPDAYWIRSLPGVGELNGARLLARLGDNRAAFQSVDMLRATAGTVPITKSSGKRHSVHFRRECSHPLRKVCYDIAMKSKSRAPWAKSYFDAQQARGHSKPRSNRALANRWVGIIWKLWQTGEIYNEDIHQANRQKGIVAMLAS